ncbi:hypothetical protein BC835DRAFT_1072493 [Cytidiella melzeri]|nr:hypothetical protein BC835DRAFT_1072493 [Cytidiella melzeri]
MHPSLRLANATPHRVHKPLIHFIGKRQWPSAPQPQHPHPQAPADLQKSFSEFLTGGAQVFTDFWQAPQRFWKRELSEAEIEVITSGGASLK